MSSTTARRRGGESARNHVSRAEFFSWSRFAAEGLRRRAVGLDAALARSGFARSAQTAASTPRFKTILALALASAAATELTPETWDDAVDGKTIFVKFLAPW
ncbi:intramolecular oxidoreductase [Aureococcus anophagefferens]|nr:intramolecular oxidoreductase [Aureococcus anophagefferens]